MADDVMTWASLIYLIECIDVGDCPLKQDVLQAMERHVEEITKTKDNTPYKFTTDADF